MNDLLDSSKALLKIEADGVAVPRIPAAAVVCLEWCVEEIERLRRAHSDAVEWIAGVGRQCEKYSTANKTE